MFNISEFKSRINKFGGPGRTSLFVVKFAQRGVPSEFISTDDLRFFCQTITVPGINLELMQYRQSGVGYPEFMPMNSIPDNMNAVFLLDSNHRIISFFHNWINSVVNVSGSAGPSNRGLEQKEINYKSDYTTSMEIDMFSYHDTSSFYRCIYDGVFPTQVGSLNLNWNDSNSYATVPVNFSYNRLVYSGFEEIRNENSRFFTGEQTSIVQNLTLQQIVRDFDQRFIDIGAAPLI